MVNRRIPPPNVVEFHSPEFRFELRQRPETSFRWALRSSGAAFTRTDGLLETPSRPREWRKAS